MTALKRLAAARRDEAAVAPCTAESAVIGTDTWSGGSEGCAMFRGKTDSGDGNAKPKDLISR